jgi:hypothetical protein
MEPSDDIANRRKVARRHLIYYLRVFDRATGKQVGSLVDISTKGIMIVSDEPVEVGKHYELKMVLPETVEGKREVEFSAETRWCMNDTNPDFYDTGFELVDPAPQFLEALDRLIDDFLFKH